MKWYATLYITIQSLPCQNQVQLLEIRNDFWKKNTAQSLHLQFLQPLFQSKERGRYFVLGQVDPLYINFDCLTSVDKSVVVKI